MPEATVESRPAGAQNGQFTSCHRERGNGLYKSGKLLEAIDAYRDACAAAPEDPRPLSNLSATHFEVGDYRESIKTAQHALTLLHSRSDPLASRLQTRLAKAYILRRRYKEALEALDSSEPQDRAMTDAIERTNITLQEVGDVSNYRMKIINTLPRYLPMMQDFPEYYNVGHDNAIPQVDVPLIYMSGPKETLSFLFGGIGDARHLYATLTSIAEAEYSLSIDELPRRRWHFTCVELKARSLARLLIVLLLLHRLSLTNKYSSGKAQRIIATAFYTFVAPVMPPYAYEQLQETISYALRMLEGCEEIPEWICIYEQDRQALITALESWQNDTADAWPPSKMRALAMEEFNSIQGRHPTPDGCQVEKRCYLNTGLLYPPLQFLDQDEPHLKALIATYRQSDGSKKVASAICKYIDVKWRPNVTLADVEYQLPDLYFENKPCITHDPFQVMARQLQSPNTTCPKQLYDYAFCFFTNLTKAISHLKGRFVIEFMNSEITKTMEQLRYSNTDHRGSGSLNALNLEKFPRRFDRIHLSNIPDYIGGPLTTFIYALPITKQMHGTSWVTTNVLRNNSAFKDQTDPKPLLNEYLCESDYQVLSKIMNVEPATHGLRPDAMEDYTLDEYLYWVRRDSKRLSFPDLLHRSTLEKWLYTMFLKITIPYPRKFVGSAWDGSIYSPLNITTIFRVIIHLHELGYPAHWLGGFLSSILSGKIATNARPPRSCPLTIPELKQQRSVRNMNVSPFVAEMQAQAIIWMPLLPFGFVSPDLPDLQDIHQYTLYLKDAQYFYNNVPHFVLVFLNSDLFKGDAKTFREALLDDETGNFSANDRRLREEGIIVISVFEWTNTAKDIAQGARFWLSKSVVDRMLKGGNWVSVLYRNDSWMPHSDSCPVKNGPEGIQRGERWMDMRNMAE
ncbi:hypothetical protein AOQ84DRAFT_308742 [Glonium stellatum]|uniref:DUF4470 domain-containing protein n=1 Tax=Glonium stellatum TaxID=574774 RepID=A0A8E2JZ72_9PEZI|nr:hypothetical protein AOQ84DRAFT_308742 [Glonium stellatum]